MKKCLSKDIKKASTKTASTNSLLCYPVQLNLASKDCPINEHSKKNLIIKQKSSSIDLCSLSTQSFNSSQGIGNITKLNTKLESKSIGKKEAAASNSRNQSVQPFHLIQTKSKKDMTSHKKETSQINKLTTSKKYLKPDKKQNESIKKSITLLKEKIFSKTNVIHTKPNETSIGKQHSLEKIEFSERGLDPKTNSVDDYLIHPIIEINENEMCTTTETDADGQKSQLFSSDLICRQHFFLNSENIPGICDDANEKSSNASCSLIKDMTTKDCTILESQTSWKAKPNFISNIEETTEIIVNQPACSSLHKRFTTNKSLNLKGVRQHYEVKIQENCAKDIIKESVKLTSNLVEDNITNELKLRNKSIERQLNSKADIMNLPRQMKPAEHQGKQIAFPIVKGNYSFDHLSAFEHGMQSICQPFNENDLLSKCLC